MYAMLPTKKSMNVSAAAHAVPVRQVAAVPTAVVRAAAADAVFKVLFGGRLKVKLVQPRIRRGTLLFCLTLKRQ